MNDKINVYEILKAEITNSNTENLMSSDFTCTQFCGSYALDLLIGHYFYSGPNIARYNMIYGKHFYNSIQRQNYTSKGLSLQIHTTWTRSLLHNFVALKQKGQVFAALYLKLKTSLVLANTIYKGNYYSFNGANEKAINSFRRRSMEI